MTTRDHLQALIQQGAVIGVYHIMQEYPIGLAELQANRLVFMVPFAEDQHHVHEVRFDSLEGDESLVVLRLRGTPVAEVMHHERWGVMEPVEWQQQWQAWTQELASHQADYVDFMRSAFTMGIAEDADDQ